MSGGQLEDAGGKIDRGAGQLDSAGGVIKRKTRKKSTKTMAKKVQRLKRVSLEIALKKPGLTVSVHVTDEMKTEAVNLAREAEELTKRKKMQRLFPYETENERTAGYLGQFAYHQHQSGDWRNALPYIRNELNAIAEGKEMEMADAEIDGRSIDVKTTDLTAKGKWLAFDPFPWGLQVPEDKVQHKIWDFYVWVTINPLDKIAEYGEASIFGYAYGEEIKKTKPTRKKNDLYTNREINFRDLHPMRFLKPGLWNTEMARKTTLNDELSCTEVYK